MRAKENQQERPIVWYFTYANRVEQRREICRHADKVFMENGTSAESVDASRVFHTAAEAKEAARQCLYRLAASALKDIEKLSEGGGGG